jgi:hypothetical protein
VKVADVYGAYREWCEASGERAGTATAFGLAMAEKGFRKDAGKRWYMGLRPRPPEDEDKKSQETHKEPELGEQGEIPF